jgi:hypothetical protein
MALKVGGRRAEPALSIEVKINERTKSVRSLRSYRHSTHYFRAALCRLSDKSEV